MPRFLVPLFGNDIASQLDAITMISRTLEDVPVKTYPASTDMQMVRTRTGACETRMCGSPKGEPARQSSSTPT